MKILQQTQRGQSPEGQTDPARSEEGQTRQDPARSEPYCKPQLSWSVVMSGPSRSLKVSSTMSCDEQLEKAQREVPCLSRHEPVPQPEGQSASRPVRPLTQPSPVCFYRPRASRSSSRGRGVGLVFLLCAPSFSSLFFRFSVLVSRVLSWSRRCAVATSAIRGVSRGGCVASPCSGEVPPT